MVPAARPDIGAVPDCPTGDRGAAVLCHYRRHAGAALLGSGARCRGPLRSRGQRPMFLLCQCFVTLVVPCRDRSVPLVTGLCRSSGNAGKIAMAMLRAVGALVPAARRLVQARVACPHRLAPRPRGHRPGDTALFALPPPREPARRGRLYGARLDAEAVAALPASAIAGYGGPAAPYRVPPTLPQGRHHPWCELEKGSGWAKARLLLSTDPTLSAPVEAYSGRWTIEPLFRDLKTVDGLGAMWQRGRIALLRWLHLVQIAETPADRVRRAADPCPDPPRRLAATLVKEALAARFRNFEAFRLLPETYRNAAPLRSTGPPVNAVAA